MRTFGHQSQLSESFTYQHSKKNMTNIGISHFSQEIASSSKCMAIEVTFYQEPDAEILRTQAKKWVYAAQSWLSEIPYEKIRLNIDENTSISTVSKPINVFTQTSIQIILLSSLKTRIEILRVCNTLNTEPLYEEVSRLGGIMTKECRASGSFLRKNQSQRANQRPTQLQV
jgi:hypothetical protein